METRQAITADIHLSTIRDLVEECGTKVPELLSRLERALIILAFREIEPHPEYPGQWLVSNEQNDHDYAVVEPSATRPGACTCPDFDRAPRGWCKHRLALSLARKAAEIEALAARRQAERAGRAEEFAIASSALGIANAVHHFPPCRVGRC